LTRLRPYTKRENTKVCQQEIADLHKSSKELSKILVVSDDKEYKLDELQVSSPNVQIFIITRRKPRPLGRGYKPKI
jgi:hypothetical protein